MAVPAGFKSFSLPIAQLSLAAVLKCGQSFRWTAHPLNNIADPTTDKSDLAGAGNLESELIVPTHEYRIALKDRVVCLRQDEMALFYRSVFPVSDESARTSTAKPEVKDEPENANICVDKDEETLEWLKDYFQLEVDLIKLYSKWAERDVVFRDTVKDRFAGIRILRQDPWENVVSFICSSNNHIGRITKMVQSLCTEFSPALCTMQDDTSTTTYHAFPSPKQLSHPSVAPKLRELGFGYRAEYVQRTAEMLCSEHKDPEAYLLSLRKMSESDAREELLKLCGVGPKVADCVLLMSLDKRNVVPVDTHVHQIALKHYGLRGTPQGKGGKVPMTPKIYEAVGKKLVETWGDYAGWAHSVLFTADLRAFADYGLATPNGSPTKSSLPTTPTSVLPTPSESGSDYFGTPILDTPRKRKRKAKQSATPSKLKRVRTD